MNRQIIIILVIIVVLLLLVAGYFYGKSLTTEFIAPTPTPMPIILPTTAPTSIPTPTPTPVTVTPNPTVTISYCLPANLQATIDLSPGAGNVYGTFTLKNVSSNTCKISGGEFIGVNYDTTKVKNITVTDIGQTQSQPFILNPNQTIYSQVHYPNGPQCQSGVNQTPVTFTYKISPTSTVVFTSAQNNIPQVVQTCKSDSEMTEVQIWNMSTQPITPQ